MTTTLLYLLLLTSNCLLRIVPSNYMGAVYHELIVGGGYRLLGYLTFVLAHLGRVLHVGLVFGQVGE